MDEHLGWATQTDGPVASIKLTGAVNEDTDFAPLLAEIAKREQVQIDLSGVHRINSCGVREWVKFIRSLPANRELAFVNVSPALVNQINMISNFVGSARVLSAQAPYLCDGCGHEELVVTDLTSGALPELPSRPCPKCGAQMEFDDLEDSYFAFLQRT